MPLQLHAHSAAYCPHLKSVELNSARLMTDTWPPLHSLPGTAASEQLP